MAEDNNIRLQPREPVDDYPDSRMSNSVLIVAHPDDEILWFASLLQYIDRVIIVFRDFDALPELGRRRGNVIAELPFLVECLNIAEAGTYQLVDWWTPKTSSFGLELNASIDRSDVGVRYRENFLLIREMLKPKLSACMNVYSHNPWGEYGHEDHVQVCRIVQSLCREIGFAHRVSTYFSSRSWPLAQQYSYCIDSDPVRAKIDSEWAGEIAGIYKRHRCWTWTDDWYWDDDEYFIRCPPLALAGVELPEVPPVGLLRMIPIETDPAPSTLLP